MLLIRLLKNYLIASYMERKVVICFGKISIFKLLLYSILNVLKITNRLLSKYKEAQRYKYICQSSNDNKHNVQHISFKCMQ